MFNTACRNLGGNLSFKETACCTLGAEWIPHEHCFCATLYSKQAMSPYKALALTTGFRKNVSIRIKLFKGDAWTPEFHHFCACGAPSPTVVRLRLQLALHQAPKAGRPQDPASPAPTAKISRIPPPPSWGATALQSPCLFFT